MPNKRLVLLAVYLDGVLLGTTQTNFSTPSANSVFFEDDGGGEDLSAVIEAVRISSVARSEAEIMAQQMRVEFQQ